MRALPVALFLLMTAISPAAWAQAPATPGDAAIKTFTSSAEIADLIAKAKAERKDGQALVAERILSLAPYRATLEYRAALAPAAVRRREDRRDDGGTRR